MATATRRRNWRAAGNASRSCSKPRPFAEKAKSFTAIEPSVKPLLPQSAIKNDRVLGWKLILNTAVEIDE